MKRNFVLFVLAILGSIASATPEFARAYREFRLTCATCHTQPPRLNAFGVKFVQNGYSIPDMPRAKTVPVSAWASALANTSATNAGAFRLIPNRIELISAGRDEKSRTSYFFEWRVLSKELLNDGSQRDRSGRFEDLFIIFDASNVLQLQVGQFRALSQIDVSRRLFLSEPVAFSTAMPGNADTDPRIQSLRGFSQSGRAPGARVTLSQGDLTTSLTVPFPGEMSLPLTKEASDTASFEFEGSPKGAFVEAFRRTGVDSVGVHAFVGDNERLLFGAALQRRLADVWIEGGVTRAEFASSNEWRYSVSADWIRSEDFAAGLRLDHRQIAGHTVSITPIVSLFQSLGAQGVKLTFEGRFQDGSVPRFSLELGTFF